MAIQGTVFSTRSTTSTFSRHTSNYNRFKSVNKLGSKVSKIKIKFCRFEFCNTFCFLVSLELEKYVF